MSNQLIECTLCKTQYSSGLKNCIKCGEPNLNFTDIKENIKIVNSGTYEKVSPKSNLSVLLLFIFLGGFGAHRFYVGKIGTAILWLMLPLIAFLTTLIALSAVFTPLMIIGILLFVVMIVWGIVDFIKILTCSFKDDNNLPIKKWVH